MFKIVRTAEEIINLLDTIQDDALLAEGCSCALNYDVYNKQFWTDWLEGKVEI